MPVPGADAAEAASQLAVLGPFRIGVAVFGCLIAVLAVFALLKRRVRMLGWLMLPGIVLTVEGAALAFGPDDATTRPTGFAYTVFAASALLLLTGIAALAHPKAAR